MPTSDSLVTVEVLTTLLATAEALRHESPRLLLGAAAKHKVELTLASAWKAEGLILNPALEYQIRIENERIARYGELLEKLLRLCSGLRPIKGPAIASKYPVDWIRPLNDLDLLAAEREHVWAVVEELTSQGWTLTHCMFQLVHGRCEVAAVIQTESPDPLFMGKDSVEVRTIGFLGNRNGVPPASVRDYASLSDSAVNLLGVIEQGFERAFLIRDIIDALVLSESMSSADIPKFWDWLDRLGLWPEWARLAGVLNEVGVSNVILPSQLAVRRTKSFCTRVWRSTRLHSRPTVFMAKAARSAFLKRFIPGLLARYRVKASSRKVFDSGLPVIGFKLGDLPRVEGLEIVRNERDIFALTGVGSIYLTYGPFYSDEGHVRAKQFAATQLFQPLT